MGILGIPMLRYIDLNDAEDVLDAIRTTPPGKPLEFILHTPGGLVLPAVQIARAIKAHPGPKTVFVPHYAMSGGTLIALAADEIVLSEHAVLGPIDPQIGGLPAASVVRVARDKPIQNTDDYTLVLADVGAMAINQLQKIARELLTGTVSDNAAVAIAEQLSSGRWTHDYPITHGEAKEIGLNVSRDMPRDIMEMMALFPDTLRRTKSVRYVASEPAQAAGVAPDHRVTLTGYQPQPGARSYSYGPWNPKELKRAHPEEKRKPFWRRGDD
jgi:ClpP class serine protease